MADSLLSDWVRMQGGGGDAFGDGRDGGGAGADVRAEQQQEAQERGNDDLVQEDDACGGEQGGEGEQDVDEPLLAVVEAGGDELPALPEDPRAADDDGGDDADLHVRAEGLEGAGGLGGAEAGLVKRVEEGLQEEVEDLFAEDQGGDDDGEQAVEGVRHAGAEFLKMLPQGHDSLDDGLLGGHGVVAMQA
jgi:hypothetical protein